MSSGQRAAFISACPASGGGGTSGPTDVTLPETGYDAFGRLRVSNPYTLFEFNGILGKNDYMIQEATTGGGTSTHSAGNSYVDMSVATTGDSVIRQSREYIMYQPGKSKLVYMTGVLYSTDDPTFSTTALTARIGVFDANMGFYVQMQNGTISVIEHNAVYHNIARSNWTDPLDGTGPSGANVDFSKAQIFYFDFEWLGVGQVRCGIIQNGRYLPYYTFTHANILTQPYIQMAKLPLRYEITSTGSKNSMHMICGTVISEGGVSPIGKLFTYDNFLVTSVPAVNKNTTKLHALWGIRLKTTSPQNRATIKIKNIQLAGSDTTTVCAWKLLLNPTVDSGSNLTWADYTAINTTSYAIDSCVQIATPALSGQNINTFYTGGQTVLSGFVIGKSSTNAFNGVDELVAEIAAGSNIAGTVADELILVGVIPTSGTGNANAALTLAIEWIELM